MRHSIRRYLGWLMNDLLPSARARPGGQAVHVRYEKAGLAVYDTPVPWNADAVVVEVLLRLPPAARQKADFLLRVPGREPVPPETLRRDEADEKKYRLVFRVPVPMLSTQAELLWKHRLLSEVALPVIGPGEFLSALRLLHPTLTVRIGDRSVAAQTFVASQCRGMTAAAVLRSPTCLAPLADLGLKAVFRSDRSAAPYEVPVTLTSSQLGSKEAIVTASPGKAPRRAGGYTAAWVAADRELAVLKVQAVTRARFVQSLRVSDTRFVVADKAGAVRVVRHPPPAGPDACRVGPCFLVCSREPGMAGLVGLRAVPVPAGPAAAGLEQTILVTDGPTAFAPGTVDAAELAGANGFEVRYKEQVLGTASLNPVPVAGFTAEGGFKPPPEFAWTPTADDELGERLGRLMREDGPK